MHFLNLFFDWEPHAYCNDTVTFWLTQGGKHKVLKTYRIQTMRNEKMIACKEQFLQRIARAKDSSRTRSFKNMIVPAVGNFCKGQFRSTKVPQDECHSFFCISDFFGRCLYLKQFDFLIVFFVFFIWECIKLGVPQAHFFQ